MTPHLQVMGHIGVGLRGFEPPTPGPPDQCANQTAPQPAMGSRYLGLGADTQALMGQSSCWPTHNTPCTARHLAQRHALHVDNTTPDLPSPHICRVAGRSCLSCSCPASSARAAWTRAGPAVTSTNPPQDLLFGLGTIVSCAACLAATANKDIKMHD